MNAYIECVEGVHTRRVDSHALYSHAVTVETGRTVFVAGQVSRADSGEVVGHGDMAVQIARVLDSLESVLEAAGAVLGDVVSLTAYTTDVDSFRKHVSALLTAFPPGRRPTSTLVGIARLADPAFLVEVSAIAVVQA